MTKNIYISRRVTDFARTRKFWQALGFDDFIEVPDDYLDKTLMMRVSNEVIVCFLTDKLFDDLNITRMTAPGKNPECIVSITVESREKVDEMRAKVIAAGGRDIGEGLDYDFIYTAPFTDPDGHWWEFQWDAPSE